MTRREAIRGPSETAGEESRVDEPAGGRTDRHLWAGGILIVLGILFLLGNLNLAWWFNLGTFWPILLVAIGAILLWQRARA